MSGSMARIGGLLIALTVLLGVGGISSRAHAQGPFQTLAGNWSGGGQIKLENGKSEALKCRAYYTQKESDSLGLAIRCASASNKIELRANLSQSGSQVDGNWEERTFNAAGTVRGRVTAGRIHLTISGGTFSGSMNVAIMGERHSVSIETNGIGLRAVNISLSRG
ncbi:MAG TPA: hypothetical protein VNZ50_08005 [Hyphomicrobiaceae bacterium]|nr:hypothetical protein [Hyphomicrobiaceae bacterium]